jgi:hypothetical protein
LYNNAGGVFDTLPNSGQFAPYSPQGRGIADLKYDPNPHGIPPGEKIPHGKSAAPPDHERMFHERGVRSGNQVVARVGKDMVYRYNFGEKGPHFSAIEKVGKVESYGHSKALTTSEKTVQMQRMYQLTQPVKPGTDFRSLSADALGRRAGRN